MENSNLAFNFMPSKENIEELVMHSKSGNIEKPEKVIKEFFQSLLYRYQIEWETSVNGSGLIFDCGHLLYSKCHKINFKRVGSCMNFPHWIKKATINLINKEDNTCFKYCVTVVLSHE